MSSDLSTVNQVIKDAVFSPEVVKTQGAGKAYQSVAQSMAIAIQDATDHLRNVSSIASTAVAVTTELMLTHPEKADEYGKILEKAQGSIDRAVSAFEKVGKDAGQVLRDFPSGSD